MPSQYVALIADAIGSRTLPVGARTRLQAALRASVPELNRVYRAALAARFAFTAGDEVECLLHDARAVWDITHQIRHAFPEIDWIVACGRGAITTALAAGITAPEVDGPCFHLARRALDDAKRRRLVIALEGFAPPLQGWASYYSALYWKWTRVQREAAAWWRWEALSEGTVPRPPRPPLRKAPRRRAPSAWSHLRRRMAWPLVAAGDRMFRAALEEAL